MEELIIKKEDLQDLEILKMRYPLAGTFFNQLDQTKSNPTNNRLEDTLYHHSTHWNNFTNINDQSVENKSEIEIVGVESEKSETVEKVLTPRVEKPIEDLTNQATPVPVTNLETKPDGQKIRTDLIVELDSKPDTHLNEKKLLGEDEIIIPKIKVSKGLKTPARKLIKPKAEKLKVEKKAEGLSSKLSENSTDSFYSWLSQLDTKDAKKIKVQKQSVPKTKAKRGPKKLDEIQQLVEESQHLKEEVVSETLAQLLDRQGHKEEAIKMYEKLSHKFPDKSATFAVLIKNLKS